jgi:hypothetical protein
MTEEELTKLDTIFADLHSAIMMIFNLQELLCDIQTRAESMIDAEYLARENQRAKDSVL